jgi:hypothetical protein
MADPAALAEIERRIQVVEDNLRQLVEQAAAYSGAADEERNADRIADQQASGGVAQGAGGAAQIGRRVQPAEPLSSPCPRRNFSGAM